MRAARVRIPGGIGWVGSTEDAIDARVALYERYVAPSVGPARRERYEDEVRRPVQVPPLAVDRTEVTTAAFRTFVEASGWQADPRTLAADPSAPAVWVDLADATAFCTWAGGRLPTADEWEIAARGPDGRRFPWGDALPDGTRANFCDRSCPRPWATPDHDDGFPVLAPVGSFPAGATPEGLLDLGGNAREWTSTLDPDGRARVRGGGFANAYDDLTAADVRADPWTARTPDLGFRCVADLDRGAAGSAR